MQYKLTAKPDAETLKGLKESADAMGSLMTNVAQHLGSNKVSVALIWLVAHFRYRTIKQADGQWIVTYTFPLC